MPARTSDLLCKIVNKHKEKHAEGASAKGHMKEDLLLIPLDIVLAIRLIPGHILAEHRANSRAVAARSKPVNRVAAAFVVVVWISLATLAIYLVARL